MREEDGRADRELQSDNDYVLSKQGRAGRVRDRGIPGDEDEA